MIRSSLLLLMTLVPIARAERLELKSGEVIDGTPILADDTTVKVKSKTGVERTIRRDELTSRGYLKARAAVVGDEASGHLGIARLAIDEGLIAFAQQHLSHAEHLDPSLTGVVAALREESEHKGAAALLSLAQDAVKRRDEKEARRLAELVVRRFPEAPAHPTAIELLQSLPETNIVPTPVAAPRRNGHDTEPDPLAVAIVTARRHRDEGRRIAKGNQARAHYEHAIAALQRAIEKDSEPSTNEPDRIETRKAATALLVESRLDLGHVYATRGSFEDAREQGALALALAPDDATVKDFRAHVERLIFEAGNRFRGAR